MDQSVVDQVNNIPQTPKRKILVPIVFCSIAVLLMLGAGAYIYKIKSSPKNSTDPTQSKASQNTNFDLSQASFATYKEVASIVKPVLPPYTLKSDELINLSAIAQATKTNFSSQQLSQLETTGFFLQPSKSKISDPDRVIGQEGDRSDDMVDLYSEFGGKVSPGERKAENAVFVTTDFMMHIYHVLIDRTFQKTEEVYFQPTLKQITAALYTDAVAKYNQEKNPELKESWKRLSAYYLVPQVLLNASISKPKEYFADPAAEDQTQKDDAAVDAPEAITTQLKKYQNSIDAEIYDLASQELTLVLKAKDFSVVSPLYGILKPDTPEDYTQYTPRSHYTRNSVLRSYFRAMMWYGRHSFEVKSVPLTRDALLMTWQFTTVNIDGMSVAKLWEKIYLPTVFFVGQSDDLTFYDYTNLFKNIYGEKIEYNSLQDNQKLDQFRVQAQKLAGPKILSEIKLINPDNPPTKDELLNSTKGFRFMGQRFIPDSYMFATLTQGDEAPDTQTGQRLPSTPTALMIMSILGSNAADTQLNSWIATSAPESDKVIAKVMNKLSSEFASYDEKTWTQNIYWAWLYNLKALFIPHEQGYPMFMKGEPWAKKSLATALGSWTELRHDTLLYAKQSFAELGGGGEQPTPPPVPRGYVEPNLSFITRLIALTTMTRDGLASRDLLVPGQEQKFDNFLDSLTFFKSLAEKQLSSSPITDEEYEQLRTIIRLKYPRIVWAPDGDLMTEKDARAGIIADVHTDVKLGQILYEATGVPSVIYVAVKDKGGTRLTRGVTFRHYEFTRPVSTRLTDQDWQAMVYDNKTGLPTPPNWTNDLYK